MDVSIVIIFVSNLTTSVSSKYFLTFHCYIEGKKIFSASMNDTNLVQKLDICPREYCILGVEYLHHRISTRHIAKGLKDIIIKEKIDKNQHSQHRRYFDQC